ncbi:MAG: polymerase, sigma-24 subunit, subfamily [Verrucomicrobiales bacterium]|nr:polymerase, sigma-24 subunit, subfamily [Verrucomicrobiales bacterium]
MDSDSDLLQRFAATSDQAAFTELVGRHAGMVRGVAWRRTQDWTAAEEVAQNVFAILARKAGALKHESLAGWLHRAAVLESVNAVRKAARYRKVLHHLSDHMKSPPSSGDAAWEELRPHLDEVLARLPADARHLVVLRYLERRPLAEVAAATGKNLETCRKRLQRSLCLLESLLRRRGISCTGTTLAALLAAQSLCAPPASAAALASAALRAAPNLHLTPSVKLALYLMKTGPAVKTTAVVLVLAAIPLTMLWRKNAELEAANLRLQAQAADRMAGNTAKPAQRSEPPAFGTLSGAGPQAGKSTESSPAATATAPDQVPGAILKKGRDKALRLAETEFTRLCLNLPDLTAEQKIQIREALERKSLAEIDSILHAFQSGAVANAVKDPRNLTAAGKEALNAMAKVDPRKSTPPVIDEELKTILTPEQYETHAQMQEARRIGAAEEAAGDTLKFISRTFDLTPDQKDRIFQQLARQALEPQTALVATEADPFPEIGSREEARDRIIRGNLTSQQAEVFDQKRAAERETLRRQMMEYYAKPGAAKATEPVR